MKWRCVLGDHCPHRVASERKPSKDHGKFGPAQTDTILSVNECCECGKVKRIKVGTARRLQSGAWVGEPYDR